MTDSAVSVSGPAVSATPPPRRTGAFSLSVRDAWGAYRADPHWARKSVLGGLAYLIPLVGSIGVASWLVDYERRVAWGEDRPLPPLGNLEALAVRGLYLFAGTLLWGLPLYAFIFVGVFAFVAVLGVLIAAAVAGNANVAVPAIVLTSVAFIGVFTLTALVYSVVLQAAIARFALYDRIEVFFQVRTILATLKGTWEPLLWAMVRISLIAMAVVFTVEALYFALVFGLGGLLFVMFLPLAVLPQGAPQQAAGVAALGGALLVQVAMWGFQALLMVSIFVAIFPVATMAAHVYGQWARRVYGLDAPTPPSPLP